MYSFNLIPEIPSIFSCGSEFGFPFGQIRELCGVALNQNSLTVVNFVLDDFRRPAGKRFKPRLEFFILPLHFDDFVALGFPRAGKR